MFSDSALSGDVAATSTPATGGTESAAAANSGEDRVVMEDSERGFGGNRWPKQETLALLKIRSEMDLAFRDASVKAPLWEEVSRKLAGLGYHRSAKKCKEKFENVYKYHRRTKDGRSSKGPGKTYRFFDELEAFGHQSPSPPPQKITTTTTTVTATEIATGTAQSLPVVASMPSVSHVSTVPSTTPVVQPTNLTLPSFPPTTNPTILPTNPSSASLQSTDLASDSTSSSTSSDLEVGGRKKRKRKWKDFFDRLMKEVIDKQEQLQKKFLEAIEKREQERVVREETWRMQELSRINREREILAQERKISAAKDTAVMAFLQKLSDQQQNNAPPTSTAQPPPPPPPQPPVSAPPESVTISVPPPVLPPQPLPAAPQPLVMVSPPATLTPVSNSAGTDNGREQSSGFQVTSSSRWPKVEVEALINLRTNLDSKYQENGPKGPLWEEISAGMRKLGYNRSSKRCKEKWENINKYFKKVKESNKERPVDSKTCPYFHQLDALYKERNNNKFDNSFSLKPENSVPLMVQPEQQWPPPPDDQQHRSQDSAMDDVESDEDDDRDGDEDEDDDQGAGGFEIVPNKQVSLNAAQ